MNYYGAKDLAAAFRTVRKNTLIVAEEIPEDKYSYRPAEGTKTVGEQLTHIALGPKFQEQINLVEKRTTMEGFDFMALMSTLQAEQAKPRTKAQIITPVSYTHLRAHETGRNLVCRLLLEKK